MKCMIENFLRSVWKRGGLAGATPEDAFEVHIGLGDTMTAEDILDGIMRITVLVALPILPNSLRLHSSSRHKRVDNRLLT